MELQFFDPRSEYSVFERRLPHWSQAGVVCFITWRTFDSIPFDILTQWRAERFQWLRRHGINPRDAHWRQHVERLDQASRLEFFNHFSTRWHDELDAGHGACVLKKSELAEIVSQSLIKFDGDRYELTDFVIMPNHLHLLAAFPDESSMLSQSKKWKRYQARQINHALGASGHFWQSDEFDHLVRSSESFEHLRGYIAENPRKAKLKENEFVIWSKSLK